MFRNVEREPEWDARMDAWVDDASEHPPAAEQILAARLLELIEEFLSNSRQAKAA
jgi:hypothetical protein